MREWISLVLSPQVCGHLLSHPLETNTGNERGISSFTGEKKPSSENPLYTPPKPCEINSGFKDSGKEASGVVGLYEPLAARKNYCVTVWGRASNGSCHVMPWPRHRQQEGDATVLAKSQGPALVSEFKSWLHSSNEWLYQHRGMTDCLSYQGSQWIPTFFLGSVWPLFPGWVLTPPWLGRPSQVAPSQGNPSWGRWVSLATLSHSIPCSDSWFYLPGGCPQAKEVCS